MCGIYLLFFASFLSIAKGIARLCRYFKSKKVAYIVAMILTILTAIPLFFVLWERYSLARLFYSLFGGVSVFSAFMLLRYILLNILRDFYEKLLECKFTFLKAGLKQVIERNLACLPKSIFLRNLILCVFSVVLFLGHLDLAGVDIIHNATLLAIFAGIVAILLYIVDRVAGLFALISICVAVVNKENIAFALFDGYLLIFSVFYVAIFVCHKIYGRFRKKAES